MRRMLLQFIAVLHPFTILCAQEYQPDWDVYVMQVQGKPVSVMTDLSLGKVAPLVGKPNRLLLRLQLKETGPDGFPSRYEAGLLDTLEDRLVSLFDSVMHASYVGRNTRAGLRDFYFYTNDTSSFRRLASALFEGTNGYVYSTNAKRDEKWSDYFDVLYPTPREMERIQNRRLVDRLLELKDDLAIPRQVDHTAYFRSEPSRKQFADAIVREGFRLDGGSEEKGVEGKPFALQFSRVDAVIYSRIDSIALHLWELALRYQGSYEGWATRVVGKNR